MPSCKRKTPTYYEGRHIRITLDFSAQILKVKKAWSKIISSSERE
jgi:hypothetical protein